MIFISMMKESTNYLLKESSISRWGLNFFPGERADLNSSIGAFGEYVFWQGGRTRIFWCSLQPRSHEVSLGVPEIFPAIFSLRTCGRYTANVVSEIYQVCDTHIYAWNRNNPLAFFCPSIHEKVIAFLSENLLRRQSRYPLQMRKTQSVKSGMYFTHWKENNCDVFFIVTICELWQFMNSYYQICEFWPSPRHSNNQVSHQVSEDTYTI